MAKEFENDFYNELRNGVIVDEPEANKPVDKLDELIAKKEQLLKTLEEMKANVIVDPRAIKKLEKEIKDIEKAIETGSMETPSEETLISEEVKEEEDKEIEEAHKKEEEKVEEAVIQENEEQIVVENEKSEQLREQYKEALDKLYAHKIKSIEEAKQKGALVTSRESFNIELDLEEDMYRLRTEYMAMGFDDPFKARRTELRNKEKEAAEPIQRELREKARLFREYELELDRLAQEEQELREELMDPELKSERKEQIEKELGEIQEKRSGKNRFRTTISSY